MATNAPGGTRGRTCANPNQLDGVGTLTLARSRRNPNRLTLVVGVATLALALTLTLMGGPLPIRIHSGWNLTTFFFKKLKFYGVAVCMYF